MSILYDAFSVFLPELQTVKTAVLSVFSLGILLIAFKIALSIYYRTDPTTNEAFQKWHKQNMDKYESVSVAVKEYDRQLKLAREFKYLHRQEYKRELYYERRDAYRYFKEMQKQGLMPW